MCSLITNETSHPSFIIHSCYGKKVVRNVFLLFLQKRGATIYAEFLGGSFTCDAYHMTEPRPDGTSSVSNQLLVFKSRLCTRVIVIVPCLIISTGAGVILCIERALADAGISKEQINYINAHATSTPAGDLKEYQALAHCFGQNPEVASFLFSRPPQVQFCMLSLLGLTTMLAAKSKFYKIYDRTLAGSCWGRRSYRNRAGNTFNIIKTHQCILKKMK